MSLIGFFQGYGSIGQILKGIWDSFVKNQRTFRDMMIQSFLKWGEFWNFFLLGIWDTFQNILMDMGYLGPLPWPRHGTGFPSLSDEALSCGTVSI